MDIEPSGLLNREIKATCDQSPAKAGHYLKRRGNVFASTRASTLDANTRLPLFIV
jgi:hypothetical protein